MNNSNIENLIKKILYRSKMRGCRETGMILTKFAMQSVHTMTIEELIDFAFILDQNDIDLYEWITLQNPPPCGVNLRLIKELHSRFLSLGDLI